MKIAKDEKELERMNMTKARKKGGTMKKVGIVIGIVVGIFVIYAGIGLYESYQYSGSSSFTPISSPTLITKEHVINRGEVSVSANTYKKVGLDVPQGAQNPHVVGWFHAYGGSGNDIEVYVFNMEDCINWENGHWTGGLYSSGKITTSSFDVNLPNSGKYYLVYSNKFSSFSNKKVDTDMVLTWEEYE